jgi:hypothetical protein
MLKYEIMGMLTSPLSRRKGNFTLTPTLSPQGRGRLWVSL